MDVLKIPFVNKVGLKKNRDGVLELPILTEPELKRNNEYRTCLPGSDGD